MKYELKIEKMSYGSSAIGRLSLPDQERPIVVFVEYAVPGDTVLVEIFKQHKNFWEGKILEVLSPSPNRTEPFCKHFGECGGCQWQQISYDAQVSHKKDVLLHQIQKATKISVDELEPKLTVMPATKTKKYRYRAQVRSDGEKLGFYKSNSKDFIAIDECPVLATELQKKWASFKPSPEITKIEWTLESSGKILESLDANHAALGFTQINPEQNNILVDLVTKHAMTTTSKDYVLDLYAGSGNLSQKLASKFKKILCVESHGPGKKSSEIEKVATGITHLAMAVERFLTPSIFGDLCAKWSLPKNPNVVIADPPRAGLSGTATSVSKVGAEKVILVSCDPSTLARDLPSFLSHYSIEHIYLLDMFPHTYHIETVVVLNRKN